jgi:hypothetical protein
VAQTKKQKQRRAKVNAGNERKPQQGSDASIPLAAAARSQRFFRFKLQGPGAPLGRSWTMGSVCVDGPYFEPNGGKQRAACTILFDEEPYPANFDVDWQDPERDARAAEYAVVDNHVFLRAGAPAHDHANILAMEGVRGIVAAFSGRTDHRGYLPVAVEPQSDGLGPGEYYARVWRPQCHIFHDLDDLPHLRSDAKVAGHRLEALLAEVFTALHVGDRRNHSAFGHRTRELLLLACTEVENAWRAILKANNYDNRQHNNDRMTTRDYVKLKGPMRLGKWTLRLPDYPDTPDLQPFDPWAETAASQSLPWYEAYNATKHNRAQDFHKATLWSAVEAVAASWVMYGAQFGPDFVVNQSGLFGVVADPFEGDTGAGYIGPKPERASECRRRDLPLTGPR